MIGSAKVEGHVVHSPSVRLHRAWNVPTVGEIWRNPRKGGKNDTEQRSPSWNLSRFSHSCATRWLSVRSIARSLAMLETRSTTCFSHTHAHMDRTQQERHKHRPRNVQRYSEMKRSPCAEQVAARLVAAVSMAASRDGAVTPRRRGEREPIKCETVRSIRKIPSRVRHACQCLAPLRVPFIVACSRARPTRSRIVRFANAPRGALSRFLNAPFRLSITVRSIG